MSSDKPSCFVIMPFSVRDHDIEKYNNDSNHWNEVYEGLIEPAVEAAGMRIERDDKDFSSHLVAEGIWKKIEASDVVLCDLSSLNPNVYLELGWALRADKKFVLIKDEHTDFSFDLNQFHTCVYSSQLRPSSLKADVMTLSRAIKETVNDDDRQYSMVKRIALTTAIELDAGSDKQADMLELIYKKLNELFLSNRPTPTGNANLISSDSGTSTSREQFDIEQRLRRETFLVDQAECLLLELDSKGPEMARELAISSVRELSDIINHGIVKGKMLSDAVSLYARAQAVLSTFLN